MGQGRIEWQRCPVCKRWGVMETPKDVWEYNPWVDAVTVSPDSGTGDTTYLPKGVEGKDWDYTNALKGIPQLVGDDVRGLYFALD